MVDSTDKKFHSFALGNGNGGVVLYFSTHRCAM